MMLRLSLRMLPALLLLLIITSVQSQDLVVGKPEDLGFSNERLQRMTSVFQGYVQDKKMAGSVILIMRHVNKRRPQRPL